jgi:HNH endonuclease
MMAISTELRRKVSARAGNCCEYCRIAEDERLLTFHVDHIIALKHGGNDEFQNLCFACYKCNGYKGSNIATLDPQTSQPTLLFNPRTQEWNKHFQLLETGFIEPITAEGRATVFLLRMNEANRVQQRIPLMTLGRYPCKPEN